MRQRLKNPRILLISFLSLCGLFGSIYTEVFRIAPCPLCLIIRYSMVAILLVSAVSLFVRKLMFIMPIPIITAFVADIILLQRETQPQNNLCGELICEDPRFLGIRLSVWAIILLASISFLFILEVTRKNT